MRVISAQEADSDVQSLTIIILNWKCWKTFGLSFPSFQAPNTVFVYSVDFFLFIYFALLFVGRKKKNELGFGKFLSLSLFDPVACDWSEGVD